MSLLNTTDTGSGANVPDAGATTKWKDYIWVRRLGTSGEAKFYIWNENATSDATYLKWQEKSDVVVSDIPMTDGQLLIGGSSNVGTAVTLSGDATVANTGALTIGDGKITNAKVDANAAIAYGKLNLGANVTNANLAGSIGQDKLAGSIPWAKLTIADAQIPFGKIDKIFEKNIDVQGTGSAAPNGNSAVSGNFPEYSTPTGLSIPNGSQSLEGIYRVSVSSGESPCSITLPDPSSGTYDGKIFKLSIYRANTTANKGPVYLRTAGVSPTNGTCTGVLVQLTLPSGHGFLVTDKISVMGVFDPNDRSYEASSVTPTEVDAGYIKYNLPTAEVTSTSESGGALTVTTTSPHPFKTSDEVTLSGATGNNAAQYNKNHTITRTGNNTFTTTITTGDQAAGTILVSRSGLASFNSQRGVVVRADKLVDNSNGILADMVEVIPETRDNFAKKVVLDIACDSMSSGDGQWLVSGHGGMRTNHAKTGTRVTAEAASDAITAGSSGNIVLDLAEAVTAGTVLTDTATGKTVEVTADVAAGANKTVAVVNTGEAAIAGDGSDKLTLPPTRSAEFIAEIGDQVFFDPLTGEFKMPTITWKPKKSGAYGSQTP